MEGARGEAPTRGGRRGAAADEARPAAGPEQAMKRIKKLEAEMYKHARNLEFEEAARLRDQIEGCGSRRSGRRAGGWPG